MKEMWSSDLVNMKPYVPGEQPKDRRYIKLNTNENPYPPSPKAIEAVIAAANADLRLYPDGECGLLVDAIAEFTGLPRTRIFAGNGSDEVLALAFRAFFAAGAKARTPDVGYSFYPVYAAIFGTNVEYVPVNEDYTVPVERFIDTPGGVVLANPNAPTAAALPLADIERIVAGNPGRLVLIDEAYVDFGAETAAGLIDKYDNLLVVRTTSKAHSLAGIRVGWAMGCENIIAALNTVKNCVNSYTVDRIAQAGAAAALRDREYFETTRRRVMATRELAAAALRGLGFEMTESKSNFLFVTHPEFPAKELFKALRERGILVRYWDLPRVSDRLRISIGTDEDMQTLVAAIADILGKKRP